MWGSLKNYLGQYYTTTDNSKVLTEEEDVTDWVIIDKDGNELRNSPPPPSSPSPNKKPVNNQHNLNPLPLLDISNTSSPQSSPQLSPTKSEDGWLVAPPPCFTVVSPGHIESSPLEDLLIEHPSMSVYARVPDILEKAGQTEPTLNAQDSMPSFLSNDTSKLIKQCEMGVKLDSDPTDFSDLFTKDDDMKSVGCSALKEYKKKIYCKKPESSVHEMPYDRPEGRIGSQLANNENADLRTLNPSILKKLAKSKSSKAKVQKTPTVKSDADLKNFFEHVENAKPAQQAKWERDQFKLCPSYLNRQNRVHRYQSRKHHNQKKKSIAKPYAEKCGHSF